ncbi:MAG TPA: PKD domain-containing protein [Bacteroidia bacterium]|jgi:gliding motility-associated-like protein|nr:PKD domain-containing protein [Bacteroidia bacterium]
MEPITTLRGYLLSRLLHGIRILLLTTTVSFICHDTAIAKNKPDKTLSSEDGGDRGYIRSEYPRQTEISPAYYNPSTTFDSDKKNYSQSSSNNETKANSSYISSKPSIGGDKIEYFSLRLDSCHILQTVQLTFGASDADMNLFTAYYHDKIFGDDRSAYWKQVEQGTINTENDIKQYASTKIAEYTNLYKKFEDINKNYPGTVEEYIKDQSHSVLAACNPACDNIDFENGTLSAWSAYYEQNTSTTTAFSNTAPTGGACGAVQRSAYDANTNDYQVSITAGAGLDPVAGALIPVVCPTGGKYSVRIGDSTRNGAQMGIIEQPFTVTAANANFTYMYAIVLENPGHAYYQQPYFNVEILDPSGNPIANCGSYSVVSGPGLPGYTAIYYAPDNDTVYCKPWTTVFAPLQAYIGQCLTLKITSSDCALGGHFGYAYFDATCSPGIISSSPAICGNNVTLTAPGGAASYQWVGPCIIGSSAQQTVTVGCAGIYKVAVTSIASSGCSDTIVDTVKGSTPPVLTVTKIDVKCNAANTGSAISTVTGGTSPFKYKWSNGSTNSTIVNISAGTYSVKVTDASGCSDSSTVIITQPTALIAPTSVLNVSCNGGNNGMALVVVSGGIKPYTYNWTPKVSTGGVGNNLTAGTYSITVTDSNSCTTNTIAIIAQPATLITSVSSVTNVSCNGGNNGSIILNTIGGTPTYTYAWTPNVSSGNIANNLTAGTYSIAVTDANNCTTTTAINITQPTALAATISGTNVSCNGGNNGSIILNTTGGTPLYTYTWVPNVSISNTANNLTAGSYNITIKDGNGCAITENIVITQSQPIKITSSMTEPTCNGLQNGSATVSISGGVPTYNCIWNTIPTQTGFTASSIGAGTYVATITDANGCVKMDTVIVSQPPVLSATIPSSKNVTCYGDSNGSAGAYPIGGTPPYSYAWTTTPVQTSYGAINLSVGSYTVNVTDANGCTTKASIAIAQPTPVVTTASAPDSICSGTTVSIVASATGGTGSYTYQWNSSSITGSVLNVTPTNTTSYTVTAIDANGCKGNPAVVSIATWNLDAANVTVPPTQSICAGDSVSIYTNVASGTGLINISWSNGFTGSGPFKVSPLTNTTYTVTVSNQCGMSVIKTISVNIHALPVITIPEQTQASCKEAAFTYQDTTKGNSSDTYFWDFGDGFSSTTNPVSHSYLQSGTYTVTVTVTSPAGCVSKASAPANVTVYPTAIARFTPDPSEAPIANPVIAFRDASVNTTSWTWDFGDESAPSFEENPTHIYKDTGSYKIQLTSNNSYGCKDVAVDSVRILPQFIFYIPNAFSPNGDKDNDYFTGKGIGITEFSMSIYNRWGEMLYQTNDIERGWDGRVNGGGSIAQEDTYVYVVDIKDIFKQKHHYIGSVTIVK